MERQFYIMRQNRQLFINMLDSMTIEQLNEVPAGFNNNMAWNFAHIIVTQQALNYYKAGVPIKMPMEQFQKYQKGTKPTEFISQEEINYYKGLAIPLVDELEKDWNNGVLTKYEAFKTTLGVSIENNTDSIHFAATHDFLHMGYAWALRRMIISNSKKGN